MKVEQTTLCERQCTDPKDTVIIYPRGTGVFWGSPGFQKELKGGGGGNWSLLIEYKRETKEN